ncbi:hypothetical protein DH2020_023371 [Rehmannia glutinosa]|uniref:Reverse transcriptase domain-containing protein n=1 Tax=Rehmannia glutinosa TaxID=99300 RepID=A0ABR0W5U1_REHGL
MDLYEMTVVLYQPKVSQDYRSPIPCKAKRGGNARGIHKGVRGSHQRNCECPTRNVGRNLKQNLRLGILNESLARKPPSTLEELLTRVEKHIWVEKSTKPKSITKCKFVENDRNQSRKGQRKECRPSFISMNAPMAEVLIVAQKKKIIDPPQPLKNNPARACSNLYCHYHKDKGYTTKDCYILKREIERLI